MFSFMDWVALDLAIKISIEWGCDLINQLYPATFVCLSQFIFYISTRFRYCYFCFRSLIVDVEFLASSVKYVSEETTSTIHTNYSLYSTIHLEKSSRIIVTIHPIFIFGPTQLSILIVQKSIIR